MRENAKSAGKQCEASQIPLTLQAVSSSVVWRAMANPETGKPASPSKGPSRTQNPSRDILHDYLGLFRLDWNLKCLDPDSYTTLPWAYR